MDDLITNYIDTKFTPELATLIYKSMGLFNVFGHADPAIAIVQAISLDGNESRETIGDNIIQAVSNGLDDLFMAQRITLSENVELSDKAAIMEAIYAFQFREDYAPYQIVMENAFSSPRDKFIEIIADVSGIDSSNLEDMVDDVYEGSVDRMKEFIASQLKEEQEAKDPELLKKVRKNLRAYHQAFGNPAIAMRLLDFEFEYGLPFDVYYNLLKDEVVDPNDIESSVFGLLWLALISEEGMDNPQKLLNEKVEMFFVTLNEINTFNGMLHKAMSAFNNHKGHMS